MTAVFEELGFWQKRSFCRMLEQRDVAAGCELMTQGDLGNEFMVLLEGEATIEVDGEPVRSLTQGDFFGELALLPDVLEE